MAKDTMRLIVPLSLTLLLVSVSCGKKDGPPPGPAEQLGREIDKTIREAGRQAQEVQKRLGKQLEQAGEEMQRDQ
jgi:hypothetical protein